MNSEEIKSKIALLRGQGNQVDLAGVLADVLEAIIDTPAPPANDPRIVGDVSAENPATIGKGVQIGNGTSILGTVTIGQGSSIGNGTQIGNNVEIVSDIEITCPVLGTDGGFVVGFYKFFVGIEDLVITTPTGTQHRIYFDQ